MPVGDRKDPYRAFNFLIEIEGITRAGFREASGLDTAADPVEYREGGEAITPRKLPGLVKYSNISLKWGVSDDHDLWDWHNKALTGKVERKNGSIILLDEAGAEKLRWNFRNAWPSKWTGPTFNATSNEVAIDSLEIVHEGVQPA
jgi:phage tail-like protein